MISGINLETVKDGKRKKCKFNDMNLHFLSWKNSF